MSLQRTLWQLLVEFVVSTMTNREDVVGLNLANDRYYVSYWFVGFASTSLYFVFICFTSSKCGYIKTY